MAVTIDIGVDNDLHCPNKQDVGKRLALWALHDAYGMDGVCSGPLYDSMKIEGNRVHLSFKFIGGGLAAKGDTLTGFTIAGEDHNFVPAEAKIAGTTVVVWSEKVTKPAAVRYAWEDNPKSLLFNKEGLPAAPFRTDR